MLWLIGATVVVVGALVAVQPLLNARVAHAAGRRAAVVAGAGTFDPVEVVARDGQPSQTHSPGPTEPPRPPDCRAPASETTKPRDLRGFREYRYGDSNPGFRRERAAS